MVLQINIKSRILKLQFKRFALIVGISVFYKELLFNFTVKKHFSSTDEKNDHKTQYLILKKFYGLD